MLIASVALALLLGLIAFMALYLSHTSTPAR
jgi:hypothetical protein